jgi:excisionase family DNA binding protein
MDITFEKLPQAVTEILKRIENVERLFLTQLAGPQLEQDHWFSLEEFCDYHPDKPAKATVYGWVSKREVPFHKHGKKLRFLKSEVDLMLKEGRFRSKSEIESEATGSMMRSK